MHSSVYYPQANGHVEWFNRVFKDFVQVAMLEQRPLRQAVTDYLAIYRCTPHATTGVAPSVLLHGRLPRTRLDIVSHPSPTFFSDPASELYRLRQRMKSKQGYSKKYTDRRRVAKKTTVSVGDFVRIKKPGISAKGDLAFNHPQKVAHQRSGLTMDELGTLRGYLRYLRHQPRGIRIITLPPNLRSSLRRLSDPRIAPQ